MPVLVKPPPGIPLRADAPFASDLLDFWALRDPSTQQSYRSLGKARSTLTLSNSSFAAIQSGPIGPEFRLDTGSTGYAATTTTLPISAPPFTLFCAARLTTINGGGRSLIGLFDAGITNGWSIVAIGYNAVSDNRFGIRLGATFTNGTNLGSLASNVHGVVLKVPAVGSNATIYGNGSLWGTSSNTVPSFTAARLCLGNYADYGGYAGIQCAGIIGRLLSDAEAIELSSLLQLDPMYLVRPRRRMGWIAAATATGPSPSAGSLSGSLAVPTLAASATHTSPSPSAGSLSGSLDVPTLSASATHTGPSPSAGSLSGSLDVPTLAVSATHTGPSPSAGSLSGSLAVPTFAGAGLATAAGSSAANLVGSLAVPTLAATATHAAAGASAGSLSASLAVPTLASAATSTGPTTATGTLAATLSTLSLVSVGHVVNLVTYTGDVREAIVAALGSDAPLVAIVGSRVRPGFLPLGEARPAITFTVIERAVDHNLSERSGIALARVQIDLWAGSMADLVAMRDRVETVLDCRSGTVAGTFLLWAHQLGERDLSEPPRDGSDAWYRRISLDYRVKFRVPTALS